MVFDPRTKLLILSITSISVFLNESIVIECLFTAIPVFLLLQAKEFRTALRYGILFIVLLMVQLFVILKLPVTIGGVNHLVRQAQRRHAHAPRPGESRDLTVGHGVGHALDVLGLVEVGAMADS